MWVGSNNHPTHTKYDGSSTREHCENGEPVNKSVFDQCSSGEMYSFTFEKTGEFGYHNHLGAQDSGTVEVS
jgi:plastocyanin